MTGDQETDRAAAQEAARSLADFLVAQLAAGIDPAILATATMGIGADLMAKTLGKETAIEALRSLADELPDINLTEGDTMN